MSEQSESDIAARDGMPWLVRLLPSVQLRGDVVSFGKAADVLIVMAVALAIPWLGSALVPLSFPLLETVDPHRYWLLQTTHQIGALLLTLVVMRAFSARPWAEWGFNVRNAGTSLKMTGLFAMLVTVPLYLLMDAAPAPSDPISPWSIVAVLTTHFLVIGFTQEVLYRGFVMGVLAQRWPRAALIAGVAVPMSGLWAAMIFMLSHVKPFPPYIWPAQLGFALAFGLFYAIMYHRTGSLLGPALAHGYSNTAFVALMLMKYA